VTRRRGGGTARTRHFEYRVEGLGLAGEVVGGVGAGVLVRLYALPLTKIVELTADQLAA
jgi:hypothetical protein